MKVYLNGKMVPLAEASISAQDAAVQHGVGLFETMQAFNGRMFRLEPHVDRLVQSAGELGLAAALRPRPLADVVEHTLEANKLTEARIRLTVTGGDLSLLGTAQSGGKAAKHEPTVLCVASAPTEYPPAFFEDGVAVILADPKLNPFDPMAGHKTLNYWSRLRVLAEAAQRGAGEALWFSVSNHLAGGSVSNVILIKDGQLLTPLARGEEPDASLPSPILPGITRAAVIELAEAADIPVHRKMLSITDVLEADEAMLTNSSWQILPVVQVEKEKIGSGKPGPITLDLRSKLLELIEEETQ